MDSSNILGCMTNKERTTEDVRMVHEWLKRKTEIFKDLSIETVTEILNAAKMVEKYTNEIIIRQGDIGDCFFVLLSGSASIYINTDPSIITKEDQHDAGASFSQSKFNRGTRSGNLLKLKIENKKNVKENDRKIYGEFIGKYSDGNCFGELALLQVENVRNATIIAEEKSHLLSISRELFDKALRSQTESMYKEKIAFVNGHFLFKTWPPKARHQVAMSLLKKKISFGQDVVTQGQSTVGLIFIRKGTAKIVIDVKQHHAQFAAYMAELELLEQSSKDTLFTVSKEDTKAARSNRESANRFKRDKIEISIIGSNDIIGDIEFGFNFPTNLLTVTATELCEIYLLENVHVQRTISPKKNIPTFAILQDLAELKMNAYYKRCSIFDGLPLLKFLLTDISVEGEMESLTDQVDKQTQKVSLIPIFRSGPFIDFYGPGSVFFRNRLKRKNVKKLTNTRSLDEATNKGIKSKTYYQEEEEDIANLPEIARDPRKSLYPSTNKKDTFIDWETSSMHLNDLEGRMQSWISTFGTGVRSRTDLSIDNDILRLSRFKHNDLPEECRFIVKYKRNLNENIEESERRNLEKVDEDHKSLENAKKAPENVTRQYTEREYLRLKEEMRIKEKRLSIFRIKHSI